MRTYRALAAALSLVFAAQGHASPADNKTAAMNSMTDIFTLQEPSAVDRYFASPYKQHNTRIPDGLDALKNLAQRATTWPGVHTTIHRSLADGDLVLLQSEYWNLGNSHQTAVAFDLFRFNGAGKIVEHWDALEPLSDAGASGHMPVDGATEIRDLDKTESNRAIALAYIDQVRIMGKSREAKKVTDAQHYNDHHPPLPYIIDRPQNDPASWVKRPLSDVRYVKRHNSVAEGNFVFVQGEGKIKGDQIVEIYDLFRLEGGKIVEHWDVYQPLASPSQWANTNGPF